MSGPAALDPGSFRDPSGYVYTHGSRVFRALSAKGAASFLPVLDSGLLDRWAQAGRCVATHIATDAPVPQGLGFSPALVLEHARIPYLSYPYEWPFALLKSAALLHLDLQVEALDAGFSFSDSSAYNIQFIGSQPVLMDVLSLRPYRDGEYWEGYKQFCEQFLNPLLLSVKLGVPHAHWYRGNLHGIGIEEAAALMPWRSKFSPNMFAHVHLHAKLTASARGQQTGPAKAMRPMSKVRLRALLTSMRGWVASFKPRGQGETFWADYDRNNSYAPEAAAQKRRFIQEYVRAVQPATVYDFGCNSGDYS